MIVKKIFMDFDRLKNIDYIDITIFIVPVIHFF